MIELLDNFLDKVLVFMVAAFESRTTLSLAF